MSLYAYDKFVGTTDIYYFWNDMNEPSVFDAEEQTFPKNAYHKLSDGTRVKSRDVHNAYGSLMHRTTQRGLLQRDGNARRPFVLTRSFFIGSQKYGAYWTGDTTATFTEMQGSIWTIMSSGVAGMFFGGSDIPGYMGDPS
jgi:mannosyl-oligosaccharide alpha-1,3-glucosidase